MKKLETKKVNIVICWNNLKNIAPREFPNIEEMEKTGEILDILSETVPEFVKIIKEGEELNARIGAGILSADDAAKTRAEWLGRSAKLEAKEKEKKVVIEFENEIFNAFFQQTERWSKNWFNRVDEFLAFRKDMTGANSHPAKK